MTLEQIQRDIFEVVRTPLTPAERSRRHTVAGRPTRQVAEAVIRPNNRLTSLQRLEIYNRQYWFRLIGALVDDFEGLQTIVGEGRFQALAIAYLNDCPSRSFTLRDLGSRLPAWLEQHVQYAGQRAGLALDMARLEWAEVETFDNAALPPLSLAMLPTLGGDPKLGLQPHIRMLQLSYAVDELLLNLRRKTEQPGSANSASIAMPKRKRKTAAPIPKAKKPIYLVVHRHDDSVYFKRVEREAFEMLRALSQSCSLSEAIDRADWRDTAPDIAIAKVQDWFANWASLGWLAV